ncbi:MAG: MoaD/ThiS family protein [Bacillota bacterium]
MRVRVKLYSIFRLRYQDYDVERGIDVDLAPGSRLLDLFDHLQIEMRKVSMVRVNGRLNRDFCLILNDGDTLELFPLFGGG